MKEIVDRVSNAAIQLAEGKEEIATAELKEKIFTELNTIEPSVTESWRRYKIEK